MQREFYLRSVSSFNWSYRILDNHIQSQTYEKTLLNQSNFKQTLPKKYTKSSTLTLKDEYTFNFLSLNPQYNEKDLEIELIKKIRNFLTQMGADYCFIGNQYRLEIEGEEYFIDLLLFHRKLKSLVAIELKIGKFKPEYAGKMNFYLSILNDTLKLPDENPSIGIIICKEKNKTIVEYALKNMTQPIGVATYTLTKNLPKDLEHLLPSPQEISKKLESLTDESSKAENE